MAKLGFLSAGCRESRCNDPLISTLNEDVFTVRRASSTLRDTVIPLLFIFMTIFSFRIPLVYNSLVLAAMGAFIAGFRSPVFWRKMGELLRSDYLFDVLKSYFVIFFVITVVLLYTVSSDITIFRGYISVVVSLACTAVVMVFLLSKYALTCADVLRLVLYAMCLQSLIQIAGFVSPDVLAIVQLFQNESDSEMLQLGYGGLRGLALSGELTFALSATYGFSFIILFYLVVNAGISRFSSYVAGFLLVIGSMFAGRTAFIGLAVGVLYYLSASGFGAKAFLRLGMNIIIVLVVCAAALTFFASEQTEALLRFAFEFVYAYLEGNSVETESTNILMESLRLQFDPTTLAFGDGMYTNADGSYYKKIDSGYARQILFGGVAFLVVCFVNQLAVLRVFLSSVWGGAQIGLRRMSLFAYGYLAVLHVKGEAIGYIKFVQVIIFMCSLALIHEFLVRRRISPDPSGECKDGPAEGCTA